METFRIYANDLLDKRALAYDVTSLLASITGGGSVNIFGTPSNNELAVWTSADTIEGDGNITWDGASLTLIGNVTADEIKLVETGGGIDTVSFIAPTAITASYTVTMPSTVGSTGQVLRTIDGAGTLDWVSSPSGSGANNQVALWDGTSNIDSSGNLTFDGSTLSLIGNKQIDGALRLLESGAGSDYVGITAPAAVTTSYTVTLPATVGSSGQGLVTTDGAGTLGWSSVPTGSGTDNQVALWNGTSAIDGSVNMTFDGATLSLTANQELEGDLRIVETGGPEYVGFSVPAITTSYTVTMPAAVGGSNQSLVTTDGVGTLGWSTVPTGSGTDNYVALWNGTNAIDGSVNLQFDGSLLSLEGDLRIIETGGSDYVGLSVPAITTSYTLTLPPAVGSTGQSLITTDASGTLGWSTVTTRDFMIQPNQINVNTTTPNSIAYFAWSDSDYSTLPAGKVVYYLADISDRDFTLDVFNETTAVSIGTHTIALGSGDGIRTLSITNPGGDARLSFRVYKSASGGVSPQIYGMQIKF